MSVKVTVSKNQRRRAILKARKAAKAEQSSPKVNSPPHDDLAHSTNGIDSSKEQHNDTNTISSLPSQPVINTAQLIPEIQSNIYDYDNDSDNIDEVDQSISESNPLFEHFKSVFDKFLQTGSDSTNDIDKPEVFYDEDHEIPNEDVTDKATVKPSKRSLRAQNRLSVAELKAIVKKPELVEWTDVSSSDPRLLLAIKSHINVIPVPDHWSLKREYLSTKRGIQKPPFMLPKFIQDTGIAEMRDAILEKQAEQTLKQKQRERVQPKMKRMDVDYQKLYEAFFKFQTKPELTRYGEVYYEGKEFETNLRHLRPGELSEELTLALNIPPGAPPPWLVNQQRFGPPPSYPALKIPGLNAPLPPGAQWGFHPGEYGKPPVDEYNRPLYGGDLFGVAQPKINLQQGEPIERTFWGELQAPEDQSEDDESEEEDEDDDDDDVTMVEKDDFSGLQTPSGLETPGGIASTVISEYGGVESIARDFTLRKQRPEVIEDNNSDQPSSAYQVLEEHPVKPQGFFGSNRAYY